MKIREKGEEKMKTAIYLNLLMVAAIAVFASALATFARIAANAVFEPIVRAVSH